ncbi:MAG: LytTR family DNA-binding domain-containing protein [Peptococcaceae bacterium]|jgi:DNA-binding LytR/AlgR family response regulator|nr:LytTR family DNA-binding domain-containing protein [Peptococcaceae bacterium]MDH7525106.1 LytTR family DNA-binding domain-containing protein [Peptococcaceae bacterium]
MIKALLVDDEFPARGELRCLLEEIGHVEVVGECEDGEEAVDFVKENDVDVVFLDIKMSVKDGVSAAWEVANLPSPPRIVFVTGFDDYAVKAFELNAVDYLVKPFSKTRLEQTICKLHEFFGSSSALPGAEFDSGVGSEIITLWSADRLVVVKIPEVFYARVEKKGKVIVCTEKGTFLTSFTLREIARKLAPPVFLQTHKSFIVNTKKIREIIPWFNKTYVLSLEGCAEEKIPVSRYYIKQFKKSMGI